jgi:hypothetical protein
MNDEITSTAEPKPDWQSKTIIGIAVALLAKGAELIWPEIDVDPTALTDAALELIQIAALLFAWYGRRVAQRLIAIRKPAAPHAPQPFLSAHGYAPASPPDSHERDADGDEFYGATGHHGDTG